MADGCPLLRQIRLRLLTGDHQSRAPPHLISLCCLRTASPTDNIVSDRVPAQKHSSLLLTISAALLSYILSLYIISIMAGCRRSSKKRPLRETSVAGLVFSLTVLSSLASAYQQPLYFNSPEAPLIPPRIPSTDSPSLSEIHEFVSILCPFPVYT